MILGDRFLQSPHINMCIDLRGSNICVPQEFLYDSQISTASQQVGCETVPQRVRMYIMEASLCGMFCHNLPYHDSGDRAPGT